MKLQDFVLRIGPSLVCFGQFKAAVLECFPRGQALRHELFKVLHIDGEEPNALIGCLDDLAKRRLELFEIRGLCRELGGDPYGHVVVLALAFLVGLHRISVLLLGFDLRDPSDRLPALDVIADGNAERSEPSFRGGDGVDNAATANQNSLACNTGRDTAVDAPANSCGQRDGQDCGQYPVGRFGDGDEMIEFFRRRGALQGAGAKDTFGAVGHPLLPRRSPARPLLPPVRIG